MDWNNNTSKTKKVPRFLHRGKLIFCLAFWHAAVIWSIKLILWSVVTLSLREGLMFITSAWYSFQHSTFRLFLIRCLYYRLKFKRIKLNHIRRRHRNINLWPGIFWRSAQFYRFDVIYQTQERVFHWSDFQTLSEVVEKTRRSRDFLTWPSSRWVFDIAFQTITNSWRKSKQKFTKFYTK